ncbi:thioredoxin TrxA [Planctobacterium marinum]|uniref:thioredoxin TrxA n=1 Tax=Planctobacterium marinum TaxID=1631968 RepID=UPI001E4B800D|nr:thioredoxin TrxA [Planctobacterium marinum]MCC2607055.1 thioredoxin TrxA [Planctobacterium marinum]
MSDKIVTLSDSSFESDVIKSEKPVLVDFWAPWCGPCKMIAPILNAIAEDDNFASKITVGKLNVDDNVETAGKYGVRGIPTLLIFKNGEVIGTKVGALSRAQLEQFISESVA